MNKRNIFSILGIIIFSGILFGGYKIYTEIARKKIIQKEPWRIDEKLRAEKYQETKSACDKKGAITIANTGNCLTGYGCGWSCATPTNDAEKTCYAKSDCSGVCECAKTTDNQGFQMGKCSKYIEGEVGQDCGCTLQEKTKTLKGREWCY